MADTVEQVNIRGLDIDKTVKGFALIEYVFKKDLLVVGTKSDSVRWYQETATDLTATAPSVVGNHGFLSTPTYLEPSWTRNTSYIQEFMAEAYISEMDIESADIDVLARTLLRLTRAVVKTVDTLIYNTLAGVVGTALDSIHVIATSGAWTAGAGSDPIKDILFAKEHLISNGYQAEGASLFMDQTTHRALLDWLIWTKGSNIPQFASSSVTSGTVLQILGVNVKVSPNVAADKALLFLPQRSATYKQFTDTTSRVIDDPGLGKKIRVWERGLPIITDPKSIALISNTV